MSVFNNCADFQVHNGTFYAVHGDLNFHPRRVDVNTLQIGSPNEESPPTIVAANSRPKIGGPTTREESGTHVRNRSGASDVRSFNGAGTNPATQPQSTPSGSGPLPNFSSETGGGGTYITAGNVNHFHPRSDLGIHILHRSIALEAIYDSAESFPQPRCHPETRTEMLDGSWKWATNTHLPVPVPWLYGPAGAGKSAVMQTLSQRLENAGRLGGTFFFKRGHPTRGNGRVLFATLAYQLALHNESNLKPLISERVEQYPAAVGKSMAFQLGELIVEPCRFVTGSAPQVLLVDGLDECYGATAQQEILRTIRDIFCAQSLPLRIIVASRPEPDIREVFEETAFNGLYETLNIEQSFQDVEAYLRKEFLRIHREHKETMAAVPEPWPHPVVAELVQKSSGYFIYAATAIKFVDDRDFRPSERLEELRLPNPDSDSPFAHLDQMYIQILSTVLVPVRPRLLSILGAMMEFNNAKVVVIAELVQLSVGDIQLTCRRLSSLLQVIPRLAVHHASFLDFLGDPTRSGEFHCGSQHEMWWWGMPMGLWRWHFDIVVE
ncbi:hypothetical protein DFH06DRAFT_1142915 [Mycena polygramma]|nr:hypothetical protein DFH06DRAFT_1142915 [Mycena polygramma]